MPKPPKQSYHYIWSDLLKLRKVDLQYINISLDYWGIASCLGTEVNPRDSCITFTIFFSPHFSNIRGRQYDQETTYGNKSISRCSLIQSIFITMNGCDLWNIPVWTLYIETTINNEWGSDPDKHFIRHHNIPTIEMNIFHKFYSFHPDFLVMVQFVRPEEVPPYAIYKVTITVTYIVLNVSIEARTDKYQSSSVYGWNQLSSSTCVYMTVTNILNILFESDNPVVNEGNVFYVQLIRHFIYDDRMTKYLTGQPPEQIHFTVHNQR